MVLGSNVGIVFREQLQSLVEVDSTVEVWFALPGQKSAVRGFDMDMAEKVWLGMRLSVAVCSNDGFEPSSSDAQVGECCRLLTEC